MLKEVMDLDQAKNKRAAIEKFMKWYGITAAAWCEKAGMSPNTLYGFLNGKSNDINYGTLEKLAKALNVSVGMIMGEVGGLREDPDLPFQPKPATARTLQEREALDTFRLLKDSDKSKVLGYMTGMSETTKPKKKPKK